MEADIDKLLGEDEEQERRAPAVDVPDIDKLVSSSQAIKEIRRELSEQRKELSEIVEKYSQAVSAVEEIKEIMSGLIQSLQQVGSNNGQRAQQTSGEVRGNLLESLAPLLQLVAAGAQGGGASETEDATVRAMKNFVEVFKLFNDMQVSMAKAQAEIRKSWSLGPTRHVETEG